MTFVRARALPLLFIAGAIWILTSASAYHLFQFTRVASLAMVTVGLGVMIGRGGLISAGHSALMGLGAYVTAGFMVHRSWNTAAAVAAAVVFCLLAGVLLGIPALRIRGFALAIVTLGLAVIFGPMLRRLKSLTGGVNGISTRRVHSPTHFFSDAQWLFLLAALSLGLVVLVLTWYLSTPHGRRLEAVRVDEDLAESLGIHVPTTKLFVFGISAGFAGLGGAFNQLAVQSSTPDSYTFALSLSLIVAVVVGGERSLAGGVLGAIFIVFVPEYTGTRAPSLVFAAVLLLVVYLVPAGLIGVPDRVAALGRRVQRARRAQRRSRIGVAE